MAPMLTYRDLTRTDIALLTHALAQPQASSAHTADLPSHLRSKFPCISPGCPRHKRLNSAPLDDLAGAFRHEGTHFLSTVWGPLSEQGLFDVHQQDMLGALQAVAKIALGDCSVCWLEYIGMNPHASVALGAFIVGRVNPGIYQKSNRLLWLEEMLRRTLTTSSVETEIKRMWESGIVLRRIRKATSIECGERRGYVAEYVRRARDLDLVTAIRAAPKQSTEDDERTTQMNVPLGDALEDDGGEYRTDQQDIFMHHRPQSESMMPPSTEASGARYDVGSSQSVRTCPTSAPRQGSIEPSQQQQISSNHSSWWISSSKPISTASNTSTQIIDLYRHSVFPENTAFDARSSTDTRQRSPIHTVARESADSGQQENPRSLLPPSNIANDYVPTRRNHSVVRKRIGKRGKALLPLGGNGHVNTLGVRTRNDWEKLVPSTRVWVDGRRV